MIKTNLYLQNPFTTSKSKDHLEALKRLDLWKEGELTELLVQDEATQKSLSDSKSVKAIAELSKNIKNQMKKCSINIQEIWDGMGYLL